MRNLFLLAAILSLLIAGCSSSSKLPTQPNSPDLPQADYSTPETDLLYSGTFEIDLETQTITSIDRQSDFIYDITWFLPDKCPGGCFRFAIVGVVGTVLEIELTLENPLAVQAYDLRVQYLNLYGKTVLNPDSYTDFLGTQITTIYPFTAFMKEDADRAFPVGPGGIDTETLFLDFPPGASPSVDYAITAHMPDQTHEPYEIGEMTQSGELTPSGGSATISCRVDDHQDDISNVFLDATPFTGAPVEMFPGTSGYYEVDISNTEGAPIDDYIQLIMALSPNPQNISTYNYVTISVTEQGLIETIVYDADFGIGRNIFSIDPEGATAPVQWTEQVDPAIWCEGPVLSPNGEYIVYLRYSWSAFADELRRIDIATGEDISITGGMVHWYSYADWRSDGQKLICSYGETIMDSFELYTMDPDGSNQEQLTATYLDPFNPVYSADDQFVYFQSFLNNELYIMEIATGMLTQYTDNGTWNDDVNKSPDGIQVAWATMYGCGCRNIYISPVAGPWNPPDKILNFDSCVRSPCFSPDGTKMVVDHGGFDASEIAVYDLVEDTWYDITGNAWGDYCADWGYMIPH